MARVHGRNLTVVDIDSTAGTTVSMLANTIALNWKVSAETHPTETMGDNWKESTPGLLGGDEITHELFYDTSTSTGTTIYYNRLQHSAPLTLSWSDGTRTYAVETLVKEVSQPIPVGDMMKVTATHIMSSSVTFT